MAKKNTILKTIFNEEMESTGKEIDKKASEDPIFRDVVQWIRKTGGPEILQKGKGFYASDVAKAIGHSEKDVNKALHKYSEMINDCFIRAMARSEDIISIS